MRLMDPHCAAAMELLWHAFKSNNIRIFFVFHHPLLTHLNDWTFFLSSFPDTNNHFRFADAQTSYSLDFLTNIWSSVLISIWFQCCSWVCHVFSVNTVHVAVRALLGALSSDWQSTLILRTYASTDTTYSNAKHGRSNTFWQIQQWNAMECHLWRPIVCRVQSQCQGQKGKRSWRL